jgi:hypothetical protein
MIQVGGMGQFHTSSGAKDLKEGVGLPGIVRRL